MKADVKIGAITLETIHKDLESMKKEIVEMKEHIIDEDRILTEEEKKLVDENIKHEKQGKLVTHDELKKELGI
jgi:hypothetical protein